jgi:hypothetical protein
MLRLRGFVFGLPCALALLAACAPIAIDIAYAADDSPVDVAAPKTAAGDDTPISGDLLPPPEDGGKHNGDVVFIGEPSDDMPPVNRDDDWFSHWLPAGLIYHSYMAGPHEPRMAIVPFGDSNGDASADATLGGRVGFWQYGNGDPVHPEGFQLDFYGAAIARLDLDNQEDLTSCDYVFGFPLTYGNERWQTKIGYAHLSSHLGDELAIRVPGSLANRANYVRDSLVWGTSMYPLPAWRVYGEAGWAFHHDGGAGAWETQFGTELSRPGPTGPHMTPFLALNGRLREDDNVGGDLSVQTGWLHRGLLGQTLRFGVHYYNGRSSQAQFFRTAEEQIGVGLWYDF